MRAIVILLIVMLSNSVAANDSPFEYEFAELAPGIWTGVRADGPRFPVMGNVTFVIGEEGVVVFDGGGSAIMAEQVIDKIRSITNVPVSHVVISHWHGDHSFGIYRYSEEFSGVEIIASDFTQRVLNSPRMKYIDRNREFIPGRLDEFRTIVETGVDAKGRERNQIDRDGAQRIVDHAEVIHEEFSRARVTPATLTFSDTYLIDLGGHIVELLHLGHGNTEGDIVMWLPKDKIVATGDIVVLPTPYAFNVPPREWAATLKNINALGYEKLVPGHGEVQLDTSYVDLNIEAAISIADQRDALLADGMSAEDVEAALDFSEFEEAFTHGDEYLKTFYDAYFEGPFRAAAMKVLSGKPMVEIDAPVEVPFTDERWTISGSETEIVEHLGEQALRLKGASAMLSDTALRNAIIEFDIAVQEERGFAGVVFRANGADYEHFYIRPHQSGNPDANQYTPVFNNLTGWQLYHGEDYAAPTQYRYDSWMHVKLIIAGGEARVFIDSDESLLRIADLKHGDITGGIGVNSSGFSTAHFANFSYTELPDAYAFPASGKSTSVIEPNVIRHYQVSAPFDDDTLTESVDLRSVENWRSVETEASGLLNLARYSGLSDSSDTVFVRARIEADKAGLKKLSIGYSDRATLFLNGTALYSGDKTYQTRDYRYLGSIGLFDDVYLPLRRGENELWIAVSENFGGWGVLAKFADMEGITLINQ